MPKGSPSIRPISPLKDLGFPILIQPTLSGVFTPNWSNPPTRSPTPERNNSNSSTSSSDSETVSESETEEEENTSPKHLRHIIGSRIPTLADITTMAEKMIVKPSKYYGRPGEDPKAWFEDFVLDAETNAWTTRNYRLLKKVGGFLAGEARD